MFMFVKVIACLFVLTIFEQNVQGASVLSTHATPVESSSQTEELSDFELSGENSFEEELKIDKQLLDQLLTEIVSREEEDEEQLMLDLLLLEYLSQNQENGKDEDLLSKIDGGISVNNQRRAKRNAERILMQKKGKILAILIQRQRFRNQRH